MYLRGRNYIKKVSCVCSPGSFKTAHAFDADFIAPLGEALARKALLNSCLLPGQHALLRTTAYGKTCTGSATSSLRPYSAPMLHMGPRSILLPAAGAAEALLCPLEGHFHSTSLISQCYLHWQWQPLSQAMRWALCQSWLAKKNEWQPEASQRDFGRDPEPHGAAAAGQTTLPKMSHNLSNTRQQDISPCQVHNENLLPK